MRLGNSFTPRRTTVQTPAPTRKAFFPNRVGGSHMRIGTILEAPPLNPSSPPGPFHPLPEHTTARLSSCLIRSSPPVSMLSYSPYYSTALRLLGVALIGP